MLKGMGVVVDAGASGELYLTNLISFFYIEIKNVLNLFKIYRQTLKSRLGFFLFPF